MSGTEFDLESLGAVLLEGEIEGIVGSLKLGLCLCDMISVIARLASFVMFIVVLVVFAFVAIGGQYVVNVHRQIIVKVRRHRKHQIDGSEAAIVVRSQ